MRASHFIQLTKPERTLANVITATAGFLFGAAGHIASAKLLFLLIGTTLVIASASVANNLTDRGIDAKMARTKKRALPTASIGVTTSICYAVFLGLAGFALLLLKTNLPVVGLGVIGYVDYVVLYGLAKRHTPHATLIGTVSGAVSLMAGYVAATGRLDYVALLLGLIMVAWQMPHFYAIAIFRRDDYAAAKIPVLSVTAGLAATKRQILNYTVAFTMVVLALSPYVDSLYLAAMGLLCAYWLYLAIIGLRRDRAETWARSSFKFSLVILLAFCALISLPKL